MKSAITRGKLKALYKHPSLFSNATLLQQFGISCMELSRFLQYISICTVLQGQYGFTYLLCACMRNVKAIVILDAPREGDGGKNIAELYTIFLSHTVK
jgi:hypothetical protein